MCERRWSVKAPMAHMLSAVGTKARRVDMVAGGLGAEWDGGVARSRGLRGEEFGESYGFGRSGGGYGEVVSMLHRDGSLGKARH